MADYTIKTGKNSSCAKCYNTIQSKTIRLSSIATMPASHLCQRHGLEPTAAACLVLTKGNAHPPRGSPQSLGCHCPTWIRLCEIPSQPIHHHGTIHHTTPTPNHVKDIPKIAQHRQTGSVDTLLVLLTRTHAYTHAYTHTLKHHWTTLHTQGKLATQTTFFLKLSG